MAEASKATSEVANSSAPQASQASSTTIVTSEPRGVTSESITSTNTVVSSENATVSTAASVTSNTSVAEPAKLTHASASSHDTDVLKPKASFSIENNNKVTGTFDAVVRDIVAPLGVKEVLIPSWSLANGQDDLIWHKAAKQMDGSYRVTIKAVDHKGEAGNYRADAYVVDRTNKRHYISEKVVSVNYSSPSATLTIENNNAATGTFDAVVKNIVAPTGVKEILVPSWSLVGGQDDLIWHKASKQADGSYRVTIKASDHKHSIGKYRADDYLVDKDDNRKYLTETVVEVNETKLSGNISILNNNGTGTFDVVISNVYSPKGVRTVQVPIWSETDGQDDIRWYEATRQTDGNYKVTVQVANHKNSTGLYNVHLYYIQNDSSQVGVGGTQTKVTLSYPKADLAITGLNNVTGSYQLVISNLVAPRGFKEVLVPTWSEKNGQDDIIWYKATKQANGDYKVTVRSSNHKGDSDLYNSHVYLVDNDGKFIGLGGKQATLNITKTQGTLTIANNDKNRGTLMLSSPISPIRVGLQVWSFLYGLTKMVKTILFGTMPQNKRMVPIR